MASSFVISVRVMRECVANLMRGRARCEDAEGFSTYSFARYRVQRFHVARAHTQLALCKFFYDPCDAGSVKLLACSIATCTQLLLGTYLA